MEIATVSSRHDESGNFNDTARFGMLLFIGAEIMIFAGFISSFLAFRGGAESWPPPGQPRLPVLVTAFNTAVLLLSAYTMKRSLQSIGQCSSVDTRERALTRYLSLTGLLGGTFLVIQGFEWLRLLEHGLSLSSGIYGAIFYTIIGAHSLHVAFALVFLFVIIGRASSRRYTADHHLGVELCAMYWYFVVGVWPILYGLVYWS